MQQVLPRGVGSCRSNGSGTQTAGPTSNQSSQACETETKLHLNCVCDDDEAVFRHDALLCCNDLNARNAFSHSLYKCQKSIQLFSITTSAELRGDARAHHSRVRPETGACRGQIATLSQVYCWSLDCGKEAGGPGERTRGGYANTMQ